MSSTVDAKKLQADESTNKKIDNKVNLTMKSKNTKSRSHEIALPFCSLKSEFHLSKLWVVGNKSFFKIQLRAKLLFSKLK